MSTELPDARLSGINAANAIVFSSTSTAALTSIIASALGYLDTVGTDEIDDEAVTLPKMAHMATASLLGRNTAATGDVEVLSASIVRAILSLATSDSPTFVGETLSGLTASELVATDGSKAMQSLAVATYPSLTELAYVKGATSAIQTQFTAKAAIQRYVELPISPGAWGPFTTNGAAPVETIYTNNEFDGYQFDSGTEEGIFCQTKLPLDYNGGTLRWNVDWDALATASGTAVFGASGGAFANSVALSTALGTERTITDTLITVGDNHASPNDATGITLAGTPVAGDFIYLKVVVKTSGTIAVDVILNHVSFQYQTKTTQPPVYS